MKRSMLIKMMKTIILSFFWICLTHNILAQATLTGNISNPVQGIPVTFIPPLKGTFFLSGYKECLLDAKGNFQANIRTVDTPSIVSFYCNNAYWRLYTAPYDADSIFVDLKAPKEIQFFGKNATINRFLNHSLQREKYFSGFADTPTEKTFLNDMHGASIEAKVLKMRDKELLLLDSFRLKNNIDSQLFKTLAADIRYYHLAIFNALTLSVYKPTLKADDIVTAFDKDWGVAWERMMERTEAVENPIAINTYWYHDYLDNFLDWYRASYKKDLDLKRLDVKKGENIFELEQIAKQHFYGKSLEVALANLIYEEAIQETMQPALISIYNRFAKDYPKSIYHGYLREALKTIENNWSNDNSNLLKNTGEIFLINNAEKINTLAQLLSGFEGKTVYLDLWATWCGPCKNEFKYKDEVEAYAKGKNLEKLYISIDLPEKEVSWQNAISFYDLNGHHIRANAELISDLRKHYSDDGKGALTLPRYMIIDKNGKVVERDALRPSDRQRLYNQLDKYLK